MKYIFLNLFFLIVGVQLIAQGNCMIYPENSNERKACEYGYKAIEFKQGSKASQLLFDTVLALNPNYAWAYYEKSVPYFKRGLLNEGILLLNKAIELDPLSYLTYRAYWYFQHQSFERCIEDLEKFYSMKNLYQKYTPGGGLNMRVLLGIIYSKIGMNKKAIESVETAIKLYTSEDFIGQYDYHVLGVLYFLNKKYEKAEEALMLSVERNDGFADTYYYLALTQKQLGDAEESINQFNKSIVRFDGKKNGYTGYPFCFPVTRSEVEKELEKSKSSFNK